MPTSLCRSLLQNNSNLTAAVIDALSNLNMATGIAEEVSKFALHLTLLCIDILLPSSHKVLEVALDRTSSADISDLPTVIKFIMQYISPKNAQDVCMLIFTSCNNYAAA